VNLTTAPAQRSISRSFIRRLAGELSSLRAEIKSALDGDTSPALTAAWRSFTSCLDREITTAEAADAFAQAIVCTRVLAQQLPAEFATCRHWLHEQAAPWEQFVLDRVSAPGIHADDAATEGNCPTWQSLTHLYEHLLRHDQPDRRKRAGVFYTPQPIVQYMLRQIDAQLCDDFHLPLGLADDATWGQLRQREPSLKVPRGVGEDDPFVRLFDPAVGTGAFLLDAIDFIHECLAGAWQQEGLFDGAIAERWNHYVPRHLLARLWGMELLPAPCFLARLHVALKLAQTGFQFGEPGRIEIHLGNTLAGPSPPLFPDTATRSVSEGRIEPAYDIPFTVVLGNPPFSYLSENQSEWITGLVRGGSGHAGYLHAGGQKLGEKKTWLHDDYVKFLRYAQWRIETTGCGIAALVTNHGYLTNATFRIMRQQLLAAFPRISVVDLHGNRKGREVSPDASRDENVFGLDQGIAIGFFRRPLLGAEKKIEFAELWGSREAKFERLSAGQIENLSYVPTAPEYRFAHQEGEIPPEYAAAPSLADLMPVHAAAPVTARDGFVLAFTRQELRERIECFTDLSIPDDEIRRRHFARTRSPRYTTGDTRSWKLAEARRIIAAESNWESFIQPCQYRPLDWRWIFWHPAMIDWPRHEVTRHFVSPKSAVHSPRSPASSDCGLGTVDPGLALIARRQIPPSEPCTYFWATSALTLDGIIRNDNRGSESLFLGGASLPTCLKDNAALLIADGVTLAHYVYALFHSPTFRRRYSAALRTGFPRVLMPRDEKLASALAKIGRQLVALHTRTPAHDEVATGGSQRLLVTVAPRFPQWADGRIWIRDDYSIAAAEEEIWHFRVGAHQIARKWLACRRGRRLTEADLAWYGVILDTVGETLRLMAEVDAAIELHGGFPAGFDSHAG
jgi:hypothetical protein